MRTLKDHFSPPPVEILRKYLIPTNPPLDPEGLTVSLLHGDERARITIPLRGEESLLIRYRTTRVGRRDAAVTSFDLPNTDLHVVQIQGGKGGYRVNNGLAWVDLSADILHQAASHPDSPIRRITMPLHTAIEGLDAAESVAAADRYQRFRRRLGLRYSHEEEIFALDLHRSS